jgi:hypothetical protein
LPIQYACQRLRTGIRYESLNGPVSVLISESSNAYFLIKKLQRAAAFWRSTGAAGAAMLPP